MVIIINSFLSTSAVKALSSLFVGILEIKSWEEDNGFTVWLFTWERIPNLKDSLEESRMALVSNHTSTLNKVSLTAFEVKSLACTSKKFHFKDR